MGRGYAVDDYRAAVAALREAVPDIALTTDVIVGFPSETREDFERTREVMQELGFDNAFIFKYSPRPGTPAARWQDDVGREEKVRRNRVLLEEQNRRALDIHRALVGSRQEVLVEGVSPRNPARWKGRTSSNKIVVFEPDSSIAVGDLVDTVIEQAFGQSLVGVLRSGIA